MGLLSDNHVYSYTQLSSFDECPYGFYMNYIEKTPDRLNNAFAEQGTLIHDLIDQWAKKKIPKEKLPDEYDRRYPLEVTMQFPRVLASKGYAEKAWQQGHDYFVHFDEFKGYEIISTEEKFKTTLCGRPFTGIIDMMLRDKDGKLIILDHKSKSKTAFRKAENEMYRQQYAYSVYVKEKYGVYPDKLMFNLFKEGGLKMERPFDMQDFDATMAWASDIMDKIESYSVLDWMEAKEESDFFCTELCSVRLNCANGVVNRGKRS